MMSNELLKRKILDSIYNNKDNNYVIEKVIKVFDIVGGSQPPKSQFSEDEKDGYVRLYQTRDYGEKPVPVYVEKNSVSKFTKKGDILLARYGGSLGKVFIAEEGAYNVALAKVIIKDSKRFYNKFVYYYFLSSKYQNFTKSLSKMAQAGFNKNDLSDLTIIIPPLEEQKKIVKKIEELFELIDKKEKNDKEKEKLKEVLKSKVLEEKLLIGDIATHKLSDFLEKTHNVNWKDTTKEFCYIDLSSVDRQKHIIEKTSIIDYNNAPSRAKQIVKKNDVLFGTTRPLLGRVCIVDEKYDNQICSTGFCVMRPKKDLLNSKFLEFIIRSSEFIKYIEPLQRGVSYPAVSDKDVYNYEIPIPPLEQQKKIVEKIEECFKLIEQL